MKQKSLLKCLITFSTSALMLIAIPSFSKEKNNEKDAFTKEAAFVKGSKTLWVAIGFGVDYDDYSYDYFAYNGVSARPAYMLIYDQGIINNAGPGTIGVGGIFAFKSAHYHYSGGYKATWTNLVFGVRGTYHLTLLKNKNNKFDPYAGVMLGVRVYNYKDTYYEDSDHSAYPVPGAFIGAKYNFTKHFGAFTELGYDISIFKIGINANF